MKYFTLVAMLVAIALALSSCCNTRYTEAHANPAHMFYIDDIVTLSADSFIYKEFKKLRHREGIVVGTVDVKTECYPQLTYEVKFYDFIDPYGLCAADLILVPTKEGK